MNAKEALQAAMDAVASFDRNLGSGGRMRELCEDVVRECGPALMAALQVAEAARDASTFRGQWASDELDEALANLDRAERALEGGQT